MNSREISIWIDERWYDALTRHLKGDTLEERLEEFVDQLCNQLPEQEYERISQEIWQEDQVRQQEKEAARQFAVFHLVENGEHRYLQVERNLELLDAARMLRAYQKHSTIADSFGQTIHAAQDISQEQFLARVHERYENTGKITGAFELDFDKEQFSALRIMDGWKTYTMKDVSTAIFHADRKDHISRNARWERFTDKLVGKELQYQPEQSDVKYIEGTQRLQTSEIAVEGEVMWCHNELEFYVPTNFDVDKVFGAEVATASRDSYVNVYAYYDLETQEVRDGLTVLLCHDNASEEEFKYKLTPEEKEVFRQRMDEICIKCGADLAECREEYLREEAEAQSHQSTDPVMRM